MTEDVSVNTVMGKGKSCFVVYCNVLFFFSAMLDYNFL